MHYLMILLVMSLIGTASSLAKEQAGDSEVEITVVYDNNPYDSRLKTAWGFSALVKFHGMKILFDSGGDSQILLDNMKHLGIAPEEVDIIMLSHIHGDHVGGLKDYPKPDRNVTLYIPVSFPEDFKERAKSLAAKVESVYEPEEIAKGVYTTGELTNGVKEQALILDVGTGIIVITGCAHPGIVKMVERAKEVVKKDVLLVMGGFHLGEKSDSDLQQIISSFRSLGVKYAGPCHCSGDKARGMFRGEYRENFIEIGVGSVVRIKEGKVKINERT